MSGRSGPFQETRDLSVTFRRPLRPGTVMATGRVISREGDTAKLEATLFDAERTEIASATATARVIDLADARNAV